MLNKLYKQGMIITQAVSNPADPVYSFPQEDFLQIDTENKAGFISMIIILMLFFFLSILGYAVEYYSLGNRKHQSSMVEAVEEENALQQTSIQSRKKMWALVIYSFSITRNFNEIFFKPYKSIKDKKFEVFNGLKFMNMTWVMLGHCYLIASEFGNSSIYLKQQMLNQFFTQIIVSADYAISFFYFISGFIGMYALIKKFQRTDISPQTEIPNTSMDDAHRPVDS